MKTLITSIILLLCMWTFCPAECLDVSQFLPRYYKGVLIDYNYFILSYNESHEQADFVIYLLNATQLEIGRSATVKRMSNFKMDKRILSKTAKHSDYTNTGYERGHLAPAADMTYDIKALKSSFYMSNVSPQKPKFNKGIWKLLEILVRNWTFEKGDICVITGPILTPSLKSIGTSTRISVPKEYFKIIYAYNKNQMIGFLLKNQKIVDSIKNYIVTVDLIEEKTGMDFFERLEDIKEEQMESQVKIDFWF